MSGELKPVIDSYYAYWFGISAFYETWAKQRGLTANGLFALYVLHETPLHCTQRLICEKLQLPKQTVNAILESFEKKGYVLKKVAEDDRRSKHLLLTQAGQRYTDALLTELFQFEERALRAMQPEEQAALVRSSHLFLKELLANLEPENPSALPAIARSAASQN